MATPPFTLVTGWCGAPCNTTQGASTGSLSWSGQAEIGLYGAGDEIQLEMTIAEKRNASGKSTTWLFNIFSAYSPGLVIFKMYTFTCLIIKCRLEKKSF